MDVVTVYSQDVADVDDINRLSEFPQTYLELLVEAITNGKRDIFFGAHTPTIFAMAAPTVTLRIPAQYIAVEGRIQFVPQTDINYTHPAPGVARDVGVYLTVRLDDQTENRDNVNLITFVQTPTARVTHRLLTHEILTTDVVSPGVIPVPAIGVGVPAPGQERLGVLLLASFTWDGVAGSFVITQNTVPVVNLGSTGLPLHGGTHITTDPIPYPTTTNRGMMPPASLPYLKESLSAIRKPVGSPLLIVADGQNGPAGDTNYTTPYNSATSKGVTLDIDIGASLNKSGNKLHTTFGTPPGGGAGVAAASARSDHKHVVFPLAIPKYFNLTISSLTGPLACPMSVMPSSGVHSILIDAGRANQIAIIQFELSTNTPDSGADNEIVTVAIGNAPSTDVRYASVRASGNGDKVMNTTLLLIPLSPTGHITVTNLLNVNGDVRFRFQVMGYLGQ